MGKLIEVCFASLRKETRARGVRKAVEKDPA
jgi:hypothetical protein